MATTGFQYHVFLSHNSADKPTVEELAVRLRREGIEPWLDKWNLIPGAPWQSAIEAVLADCATCAVFIGSGGLGPWQHEEMRAAITRRVYESHGQFRVIPVLLPRTERPERGKLPTFLTATTWVEFRHSLDDAEAFRRLVCGIRGEEPGPGPDRAPFPGQCPYRGLEVFDVEHAPFFFGREALTEWLVVALRAAPSGHENRFLAILGASGSGKSSLARAGLAAALERGALDGSGAWPIVILKPGRNPVESLAFALAKLRGDTVDTTEVRRMIANLEADPRELHLFTRLFLGNDPPAWRLVVLVDQSEEVFTLCENEAARKALFDNLFYAATVPDGQTIVVLTMRADFYGKCGPYPALAAAMSDHQLLVGPMTEDELHRAIERPALLAGGEFEPGLIEMLLQDVTGQPGSLPLLQFTLLELWQRREGRRLTVAAYKAIGKLQGAIRNRADDVLGHFDATQRDLCRRIFLRLTQPGEGVEDTKRRASFRELVPAGADPGAVEAVVRRLADARLITIEGEPRTMGKISVEVAHEALIQGWPHLRRWIDADRVGLRIHRQLTEAAREWEASRREGSFLYGGTRLAVAREWATTHHDELNALEAEFLVTSQRKRRRGMVALAASILVMLASAIGGWEWFQWQKKIQSEQLTHAVDNAVTEARQLAFATHWPEAIKVLEGVQRRLELGARHDSLRRRVASLLKSYKMKEEERKAQERDRKFVDALDEARLLEAANAKVGGFDRKAVISGYQRIFREYGLDIDTLPPERAAELIRAKPPEIREALAAALDDWAWRAGPPDAPRLRTIAREADDNPWRNAIRDAEAKGDAPALRQRAHDPDLARQPVITLDRLGYTLIKVGESDEAVALLRQAQRLHPHDFWINYNLAKAFNSSTLAQYDEAIRYLTAAVALRPDSPGANVELGFALARKGRIDEVFVYYDEAIRLDPKGVVAYSIRGLAWYTKQAYDKAIADFDKAIALDPKVAAAYIGRGNAWGRKGEYEKAIADFDKAIALDPKYALAYTGRGNAWKAKQAYDKAIADFDKAIALDPKDARAYADRGFAWSAKQAYDKAIADFDKAIALDPKDAPAYTGRGLVWSAKQAYDKAITYYDKAIALDPKDAPAYRGRGNAWSAKQVYDKAIADYDKAIALDPKDAPAYRGRGFAWSTKQAYDKAIADYDEAIRLNPKDALAYTARGDAWKAKGEYDKAIADYDEAIRLNPKDAVVYRIRGNAWKAKGEYDKAIADYNKAIALDPKDAMAYTNRGSAWGDKGEYDKAFADYDKAIALDPKDAKTYTNRGSAWGGKGEYDKAFADYDKAIRLDPKDARAYTGRGLAWYTKQAYDKAIADYDEAIRLNPKDALAYRIRGIAWSAKQAYDKAIADYDEAIRLNPKDALAYTGRGFSWSAKQEYDKAIADYDKAIALDPKDAVAYRIRGNAWKAKQAYDKAIADYDEAIRLNPKAAVAYCNRGIAWSAKQAYDKAIADFDKAIALDPKDAVAYSNRALAWTAKGGDDKAFSDCDEAIRLDPKGALAYTGRGFSWYAKQAYDKAIADYDKAIALDPKDVRAYTGRGFAWSAKQAYDKAIADYDEAIRLNPKAAPAYRGRGFAWSAKQAYDKAIADYDEAIRFEPKDAPSFNGRAWLFATCPDEKYSDGKKAVESATRACELTDWKDADSLNTLAAACAKAGDFDTAIKWQEKALGLVAKDDEPKRKGFEARLKLYQAKKPYRQESKAEPASDGSARP